MLLLVLPAREVTLASTPIAEAQHLVYMRSLKTRNKNRLLHQRNIWDAVDMNNQTQLTRVCNILDNWPATRWFNRPE